MMPCTCSIVWTLLFLFSQIMLQNHYTVTIRHFVPQRALVYFLTGAAQCRSCALPLVLCTHKGLYMTFSYCYKHQSCCCECKCAVTEKHVDIFRISPTNYT